MTVSEIDRRRRDRRRFDVHDSECRAPTDGASRDAELRWCYGQIFRSKESLPSPEAIIYSTMRWAMREGHKDVANELKAALALLRLRDVAYRSKRSTWKRPPGACSSAKGSGRRRITPLQEIQS